MNYIFYFLIIFSIIAGAITGRLSDVVNAILTGADLAVKIALSLIGVMAFWLGMMEIAKKAGFIDLISKLINPVTKRIFNEIPEDSPAIGDIAMSFTANAFGLTNAATPIGIQAMKEMQKHNINKKTASNAMCMFLTMNTAGFQLIPATVLAILIAVGSKNPTEIIFPTLIVTTITFVTGIIIAKICERIWQPQIAEKEGEV